MNKKTLTTLGKGHDIRKDIVEEYSMYSSPSNPMITEEEAKAGMSVQKLLWPRRKSTAKGLDALYYMGRW